MYDLSDTIVAVSSPACEKRVIVRITGQGAVDILKQIFTPPISAKRDARYAVRDTSLISGSVRVDDELKIDAKLYLFLAPHSYTGDDVAEIHIYTNPSVTEALIGSLLGNSGEPLRMAGPGEFTARAYLNGKIDLAQAEAVNEIITTSNKFQLDAAEKLLSGRLAETTAAIRASIMDCLSLIEAGLDFSGEDIEFITVAEAVERLAGIKRRLEQLLSASISYESVIDLPAAGIAGAPNAGKSSLLNKLLGRARSIVSDRSKTTRDVLTGELSLRHCRCVLFDCAGLTLAPSNILDELAQQAAVEALKNSSVVVFCIDISKTDHSEDIAIRNLIKCEEMIPVATKSDLLTPDMLAERLVELNKLFAAEFLPISAKTGAGVEVLRERIDRKIIELAPHQLHPEGGLKPSARAGLSPPDNWCGVVLTARHRQAITEAIENVTESANEVKADNDEVAAMVLRAAYQAISTIEQPRFLLSQESSGDEQILDRIFSRFCIGK